MRNQELVKENRAISKQRNDNKYEIAYLLYKIKSEERYKDYKSDSIVPTKCASFESFLNSYRNEIPDNEDCKALVKAGRLIDKVDARYRSFLADKHVITNVNGESFIYWEDYDVYALAAIAKKELTREKIRKLHDDGIIKPSMTEREIRSIITKY